MNNVHELNPIKFNPRKIALPGVLDKTMPQFLKLLRGHNLAANTITAYKSDLEQFAGYLGMRDIHYVQQVATHHIDDFITALTEAEGNSARSAQRKLATVKRFMGFCVGRGLVQTNPATSAEKVKVSFIPAIAPGEQELLRVIESIPTNTTIGLRDRAIFRLMFDGALRRDALPSLDLFDPAKPPANTVWPNNVVSFTNKGGDNHNNPIDETTQGYINEWLEVRQRYARTVSPHALFLSNRGTRLTPQAIHYRLKHYATKAGLPHLHMHLFRHARARHVIDKLGLQVAQQMLKHKDIRTTAAVYGLRDSAKVRQHLRDECALGTEDAA